MITNTSISKYKDHAKQVEEMFKRALPSLLHMVPENWSGIKMEEKVAGGDGEIYNQYTIPGVEGGELTIQFRNFTVKELGPNLRHCPLKSGANSVMINSIASTANNAMLNHVLSNVNQLIRNIFSSDSYCYYLLQMVSHLDHLFFYHDKEDQSMIVMRYRMRK